MMRSPRQMTCRGYAMWGSQDQGSRADGYCGGVISKLNALPSLGPVALADRGEGGGRETRLGFGCICMRKCHY